MRGLTGLRKYSKKQVQEKVDAFKENFRKLRIQLD